MKNALLRLLAIVAVFTMTLGSAGQAVLAQTPVASPEASPVAEQPAEHGIQIANMDLSVDPGDDFYQFANGGWLAQNEIPADSPSYGVFEELYDLTQQQVLGLILELAEGNTLEAGSAQSKALELFQQGTDLQTRNDQGLAPIESTLASIDQIDNLEALNQYLETSRFDGVNGFFTIDVYSDLEDSTVWAPYLFGPQLWLPSRDYYVEDDPSLEPIREAYVEAQSRLLEYAGYDADLAQDAAQAVYDLEVRLATETLTVEEQQDIANSNNPRSVTDLEQTYPLMDWASYMDALGMPPDADRILVTEVRYMDALDAIMSDTSVDVLKDFLKLQLLWTNRIYLDEVIQNISFDFRGRVLSGTEELPPIEERVLEDVNGFMGEAIGQLYVAEYFPPEAKAQVTELVDQIVIAFGARLEANPWMSDEAKAVALDKLSKMIVKVGYPDSWRGYEEIQIGDSYAASALSATNAEYQRMLARAGQPVDKTEWFFPPQTVNAFYDPADNSITFPAGILQPPFFDYQADAASNYGAVGMVIGHEITHGYDLQGSQFDADGNLNSWWTPDDQAAFDALNEQVVAQYGAIEVTPGLAVDGQLTVTENVADMGGLQVAYDAMVNVLDAEGQEGQPWFLTQQQRFFIAASSVWREEVREEFLLTLVQSDSHSPGTVRAVQPLRNMDEFYDAFNIEPGDPEYLAPEDRIVIW